MVEQKQLIRELNVIADHLTQLETEIAQVVESSREGNILMSQCYRDKKGLAALSGTMRLLRCLQCGVR